MPDTAITLKFGDGEYRFWLPIQRIIEIERRRDDKSIVTMFEEFTSGIGIEANSETPRFFGAGPVRIADVREVIRCAAIGGGEAMIAGESVKVSPNDADRLVAEYVDGRPYTETVPVAWAILNAAIMGVSLKKKADEPEDESLSPSEKDKS